MGKQENLNLEFHIKKLILKSLNKYKKISLAAKALGITERTLFKYRKDYNIFYSEILKFFYIK